jgi:outer membrane protein OmpA-like peptidoglycan-associated protein
MMTRRTLPILLAFLAFASLLSSCGSIPPGELLSHDNVVATNLGENVNSEEDDFGMVLYRNRLIVTSKRPTIEGYIQGDDLWFTDREGAGWSRALNYGGIINSEKDEGSPYITPDGEYVYFVQCETEDGLGDCDIYVAQMDYNGKWQNIRNLGENVNTKYWDSQPYLSMDGEYLYFASDRPGGQGGTDIWRCKRLRNGKWGPARNLGPEVNTGGDEKSPTLAPNGTDLFFSSNGHARMGGMDLYRSVLVKDDKWTPAQNIGQPFNSPADDMFFRLSPKEDTVFIASSRNGGRGKLDVYAVWPNPYKDSTMYTYYVRGMVFDTLTTMGIAGAALHVRPDKGAPFTVRPGRNGRFEFRTTLGAGYDVTAIAEGYDTVRTSINVPATLYYNEHRKSIGMGKPQAVRTEDDSQLPKQDVSIAYFEFDKADVLEQYREMLQRFVRDRIAPLQESKADFTIILNAHTDDMGTEAYNVALSRRRGAAVSAVLKALGVPIDQISVNAYGKSQPAQSNESDEGRALNRRVEVSIDTR